MSNTTISPNPPKRGLQLGLQALGYSHTTLRKQVKNVKDRKALASLLVPELQRLGYITIFGAAPNPVNVERALIALLDHTPERRVHWTQTPQGRQRMREINNVTRLRRNGDKVQGPGAPVPHPVAVPPPIPDLPRSGIGTFLDSLPQRVHDALDMVTDALEEMELARAELVAIEGQLRQHNLLPPEIGAKRGA